MASILLTRKWPAPVEARLKLNYDVTLNPSDQPLDRRALLGAMRQHDIVCSTVSDRLDAGMFEQPELRVRLICNYGAGFDHIPLESCARNGVVVTNTPDVLTDATAELAILLMLMVARSAGEGERELREGLWTGWRPTHMLKSTQVTGKTLGLIGFGRTGQAMAAKARGLDMTILYHSRRRLDRQIEAGLDARHVPDLRDLLGEADFVSLHCPGGVETESLIDRVRFGQMKAGAFLINTSRGSVVDESALAEVLHKGTLAGAALDVFRGEPDVSAALLGAPNLVMLPHLGSATRDTRIAMGMRALLNLEQWIAGTSPPDRVV